MRVSIEVGDGRIVRSEFDVDPSGDTAEDRSIHLADEAYETLRDVWPNLVAAAGNPYFSAEETDVAGSKTDVDPVIDVVPNPYRRPVSSRDLEVASELAPNPYRGAGARIDAEVVGELMPNPYRGSASRTDAEVASDVVPNPYRRVVLPPEPPASAPRE